MSVGLSGYASSCSCGPHGSPGSVEDMLQVPYLQAADIWDDFDPGRTGWWCLEHDSFFYRNIGNVIIPIDELIFFRGVGKNHHPVTLEELRWALFGPSKGQALWTVT